MKPILRYGAIFLLAFLPRLAALGQYVTPDEPAWVLRSVHFRHAVLAADPAGTLQAGHPGVLTMWAGALGIGVQAVFDPGAGPAIAELEALPQLDPAEDGPYHSAGRLLTAGRVAVALVNALGVTALYALARRRVGEPAAVIAAGLFALDPLAAGLGGLLHVDAPATTFMALAVMATWSALAEPGSEMPWLALGGLCAGLAVLGKSPSAFAGAFAGLLLVAAAVFRRRPIVWLARALAVFGLGALLAVVAFFPAVWAAPERVLATVFGAAGRHQGGVAWPVFFLGESTLDPGPAFYPVALALRLTPAVAAGVLLAVAGALAQGFRRPGVRAAQGLALVLYIVGYLALITFAAKKHDRYLLPAFPALALFAGLGWAWALQWLRARTQAVAAGALIVVTGAQLAFSHPYYLTSYNPLLGGGATAAQWINVGWGEAAGATARALAASPATADLWIATTQVPSFATLYPGRTFSLNDRNWPFVDRILLTLSEQQSDAHGFAAWSAVGTMEPVAGSPMPAWLIAPSGPRAQVEYLLEQAVQPDDLLVMDGPILAARDPRIVHRFGARVIVFRAPWDAADASLQIERSARGVKRVWYVPHPNASPALRAWIGSMLRGASGTPPAAGPAGIQIYTLAPGTQLAPPPPLARFGDAARLIEAAFAPSQVKYPESAYLYVAWQPVSPGAYEGVVTLVDDQGTEWVSAKVPLNGANPYEAVYGLALPPGIPPGTYQAQVQLVHAEGTPEAGQAVGAFDADGLFLGSMITLGEVQVTSPQFGPAADQLKIPQRLNVRYGDGLTLLGTGFTGGAVYSGDQVTFDLWWQNGGAGSLPASCDRLDWSLRAAQREIQSGTLALSRYPVERWQPGEIVHEFYTLELAPDLPGGSYTLEARPGCAAAGDEAVLGALDVTPRSRSFELPAAIGHPLLVTIPGLATLRGYDIGATQLRAGEALSLTLYWQATGRTPDDYKVFVHLLAADLSGPFAQSDRFPQDGAAPTSSWVPGQVIVDTYRLQLPPALVPGTYVLAVGMYAPESGRLPLVDSDGWRLPDDRAILESQVIIAP